MRRLAREFPPGARPPASEGGAGQRPPSFLLLAMEELNPSHYPATRAARVVENYVNYREGSPHRFFLKEKVTQASKEKSIVNCTAEVLYHLQDPSLAPEVNVTLDRDLEKHTEDADNKFYNKMKNLEIPIEAHTIPDNFGNVQPEMEPIRILAFVACGYVIWQNSTEDTLYSMARIETVKQVKREDEFIEFNYTVLLHDFVSQEMIPWQLQVLWHPQHGTEVKQNKRLPKRCACQKTCE
ncbi:latexin isoform X2 [Rhinatrema bivittatum]|uniref:latexin isoform X2 n=1 Tax=Rhinatrema bivittatum TaxID=194408 RepID=UPI001125E848|nr:latexin isoform X2 [Rhinatrema bivittatum]